MEDGKDPSVESGEGKARQKNGKKKGGCGFRGPSQQALAWFWTGIAAACALCFVWRILRYRYCEPAMFSALGVALVLRRMALADAKRGR